MTFPSSIITWNILAERWIVEKEENADEPWVRESLSDLETLFSPRQSCPKKFLSHSHLVLVLKRRAYKKKFYHFWSAPLGPLARSGPNRNKSSRDNVTVRDSTKLGKENIATKNIQNICNIKQFSRTLWAANCAVIFFLDIWRKSWESLPQFIDWPFV